MNFNIPQNHMHIHVQIKKFWKCHFSYSTSLVMLIIQNWTFPSTMCSGPVEPELSGLWLHKEGPTLPACHKYRHIREVIQAETNDVAYKIFAKRTQLSESLQRLFFNYLWNACSAVNLRRKLYCRSSFRRTYWRIQCELGNVFLAVWLWISGTFWILGTCITAYIPSGSSDVVSKRIWESFSDFCNL